MSIVTFVHSGQRTVPGSRHFKSERGGQLQEWLEDWDMRAPEPNHRHVSHLFGLFPGHDIDIRPYTGTGQGCETVA
jgi:hypothetical protein